MMPRMALAALFLSAGVRLSLAAQTPSRPAAGWFGAETWMTPAGAVVATVDLAGPAHQGGLVARDTIVSVDGRAVTPGGGEMSRLQHQLTPGGRVILRVTHGAVRTVTLVGTPRRPTLLPVVGVPAPQLDIFQWLNTTEQTRPSRTTFGDGHVYVVDFTATWCSMCRGMYPLLDTLAQQYAAQGLRVVYVTGLFWEPHSPDDPSEQEIALGTLQQYIDTERIHQPVAVLASVGAVAYSGYFPRLAREDESTGGYKIELPYVIVIDGAGIVRAVPGQDVPTLRQAVAALLDPAPTPTASAKP